MMEEIKLKQVALNLLQECLRGKEILAWSSYIGAGKIWKKKKHELMINHFDDTEKVNTSIGINV